MSCGMMTVRNCCVFISKYFDFYRIKQKIGCGKTSCVQYCLAVQNSLARSQHLIQQLHQKNNQIYQYYFSVSHVCEAKTLNWRSRKPDFYSFLKLMICVTTQTLAKLSTKLLCLLYSFKFTVYAVCVKICLCIFICFYMSSFECSKVKWKCLSVLKKWLK